MKNKIIAVIVVAVILIGCGFFLKSDKGVGGTSNFDTVSVSGLQVGTTTSATTFAGFQASTCDLIGSGVSQTASTTAVYDCLASGVVPGDKVVAQLASSTVAVGLGWSIVGAKASSTAGYITVILANLTGATKVPAATSVGSSTAYYAWR